MKSPCVKICKLDEKGFCLGCKRSKEEIKNWIFYTDEERNKIIISLKERK